MPSVCIFCGGKSGSLPGLEKQIDALVSTLIHYDCTLVYGGGTKGLMDKVARQFKQAGKRVIGIVPQPTCRATYQDNNQYTIQVPDLFARKQKMLELSDLYIALPGGIGTIDEILEWLSQVKHGYAVGALGILNFQGYYQPLQEQLSNIISRGFGQEASQIPVWSTDGDTLAHALIASYLPTTVIQKQVLLLHRQHQILVVQEQGKKSLFLPGIKSQGDYPDSLINWAQKRFRLSDSKPSYFGTYRAHAGGNCQNKLIELQVYEHKVGTVISSSDFASVQWISPWEVSSLGHVDRKVARDYWLRSLINL